MSRPSAATSAAVVPGAAEMAAPALMNAANAASVPLRDRARSATSGARRSPMKAATMNASVSSNSARSTEKGPSCI